MLEFIVIYGLATLFTFGAALFVRGATNWIDERQLASRVAVLTPLWPVLLAIGLANLARDLWNDAFPKED